MHSAEVKHNMKILSVSKGSPVSVPCNFYYCATHLYVFSGSAKVVCSTQWGTMSRVFTKFSLFILFAKYSSNTKQRPEKESFWGFFKCDFYAAGYMNASP